MKGFHVVNVFGVTPKKNYSPSAETIRNSDLWAIERQKELQANNINSKLIRYRRNEPLCVVYKMF